MKEPSTNDRYDLASDYSNRILASLEQSVNLPKDCRSDLRIATSIHVNRHLYTFILGKWHYRSHQYDLGKRTNSQPDFVHLLGEIKRPKMECDRVPSSTSLYKPRWGSSERLVSAIEIPLPRLLCVKTRLIFSALSKYLYLIHVVKALPFRRNSIRICKNVKISNIKSAHPS